MRFLFVFYCVFWYEQCISCSICFVYFSVFKVNFVHNKWLKRFELMSLINCMDAIKIYFKSANDFIALMSSITWIVYNMRNKCFTRSRTHALALLFTRLNWCYHSHLPFGVFGTKSRVRSLHRTYWSVPSIQMYVARILFSGKSNVKYRSKTFLLINAFGDDSSVLDIWC